jgi:hypothetical protein
LNGEPYALKGARTVVDALVVIAEKEEIAHTVLAGEFERR